MRSEFLKQPFKLKLKYERDSDGVYEFLQRKIKCAIINLSAFSAPPKSLEKKYFTLSLHRRYITLIQITKGFH